MRRRKGIVKKVGQPENNKLVQGFLVREFNCSFGPGDDRENLAPLSKPAKQRITCKDRGVNTKRGCKASFSVISHPELPVIQIRLLRKEHQNHGDVCKEAGRHTCEPRLSAATK